MFEEQSGKNISPLYISYLVRLWRSTGSPEWLASLEAPGTHERHSFPDMASFFAFLQSQTGNGQEPRETAGRSKIEDPPDLNLEPP